MQRTGFQGDFLLGKMCLVDRYCPREKGIGINMKHGDRFLGAFQRLHAEEEFLDSEIGVAFTKRIIHRHGGRTWALAEIDRGAAFYGALPRAKGRVPA